MLKQREIGQNIKTLRTAQGYSQEWAALESNLSVTWWRKIEKEKGMSEPELGYDQPRGKVKTDPEATGKNSGSKRCPLAGYRAWMRKRYAFVVGADRRSVGSPVAGAEHTYRLRGRYFSRGT